MSREDFDEHLAALVSGLDETIELLKKHGETHWLAWAEDCRHELDARDASQVLDHVLRAFGGMGSFNDLVVCAFNGHLIDEDSEANVHARLWTLRDKIWTSATAMQRELR